MKLVLLPGMDGTGDLFEPFINALDKDFEPVVINYPPDPALGYAELEERVRSQLPVGEPYVLLGESFSGPIAIAIAASRPDHLKALVLCCTFARHPQPEFVPLRPLVYLFPDRRVPVRLASFFLLGKFSTPQRRAWLAKVLATVGPSVLRARMRAVLSIDAAPLLQRITIPTLYLQAKKDRVVPRSAIRLIHKHLPQIRIASIEAPHFLLQVAPRMAAATLGEFCREYIGVLARGV